MDHLRVSSYCVKYFVKFFVMFQEQRWSSVEVTNSMEQNAHWEANSSSASQEINPHFTEPEGSLSYLQEPTTSPCHEPGKHNPILFLKKFIFLFPSYLCLGIPSVIFPSGFLTRTPYAPLLYLLHATCPIHLNHLDFITQILCGEEYRSWSSS
jgi:hypothetical protein